MFFRQLFDPGSSTYTYLVADDATHEAVIIDPVADQTERDLALLREPGTRTIRSKPRNKPASWATSRPVP